MLPRILLFTKLIPASIQLESFPEEWFSIKRGTLTSYINQLNHIQFQTAICVFFVYYLCL